MEKRRCVKSDTILINMLIHALRDVLQEEKANGVSTEVTRNLILRLAEHKDRKLYLTEEEYRKSVLAINRLRDFYIQNGRYADGIDTVLLRIMKSRYRTYRGTNKVK